MKISQSDSDEGLVRVQMTLDLPIETLKWLEALKVQLGMESRGKVVALLLDKLLPERQSDDEECPMS